jgi:hypothetical protein
MSLKGRLKRLEAARRKASRGDDTYDLACPVARWELDYLAVLEEYLRLEDSMSTEPTNQWRGGVPVLRERIHARGREEKRLAWCEYHQELAERHRAVERHQDRCYYEPQLPGG